MRFAPITREHHNSRPLRRLAILRRLLALREVHGMRPGGRAGLDSGEKLSALSPSHPTLKRFFVPKADLQGRDTGWCSRSALACRFQGRHGWRMAASLDFLREKSAAGDFSSLSGLFRSGAVSCDTCEPWRAEKDRTSSTSRAFRPTKRAWVTRCHLVSSSLMRCRPEDGGRLRLREEHLDFPHGLSLKGVQTEFKLNYKHV